MFESESKVHDFFYGAIPEEHVSHNEHTLDVGLLHSSIFMNSHLYNFFFIFSDSILSSCLSIILSWKGSFIVKICIVQQKCL